MRKSDELAASGSCLNRAASDEPIFVLRANDETAPGIVREWARRYLGEKLAEGQPTSAQALKYAEAMELAGQMEDWRRDQIPF